jgi:hypothetical protein
MNNVTAVVYVYGPADSESHFSLKIPLLPGSNLAATLSLAAIYLQIMDYKS